MWRSGAGGLIFVNLAFFPFIYIAAGENLLLFRGATLWITLCWDFQKPLGREYFGFKNSSSKSKKPEGGGGLMGGGKGVAYYIKPGQSPGGLGALFMLRLFGSLSLSIPFYCF